MTLKKPKVKGAKSKGTKKKQKEKDAKWKGQDSDGEEDNEVDDEVWSLFMKHLPALVYLKITGSVTCSSDTRRT